MPIFVKLKTLGLSIYNEKINTYLLKADQLLENNYKNLHIADYFIALAYFFLNIKNDKLGAKKWIERFDELNISLNHYAKYLNDWYSYCKKELNQ